MAITRMIPTARCTIPPRRVFSNVHHNLCEYGSLRVSRKNPGRSRMTRTPSMEQNVLDAVDRNPSTRIRAIAAAVRDSRRTVHRVFQAEFL